MKEVDQALATLYALDGSERAYVRGVLAYFRSGGLTKTEVKRAIQHLKFDSSDTIGTTEAKQIKKTLFKLF